MILHPSCITSPPSISSVILSPANSISWSGPSTQCFPEKVLLTVYIEESIQCIMRCSKMFQTHKSKNTHTQTAFIYKIGQDEFYAHRYMCLQVLGNHKMSCPIDSTANVVLLCTVELLTALNLLCDSQTREMQKSNARIGREGRKCPTFQRLELIWKISLRTLCYSELQGISCDRFCTVLYF